MKKIQHDKDKSNFGCNFNLVADIVEVIYAEEITAEEIIEFTTPIVAEKTKREEYEDAAAERKRKKDLEIQNKVRSV